MQSTRGNDYQENSQTAITLLHYFLVASSARYKLRQIFGEWVETLINDSLVQSVVLSCAALSRSSVTGLRTRSTEFCTHIPHSSCIFEQIINVPQSFIFYRRRERERVRVREGQRVAEWRKILLFKQNRDVYCILCNDHLYYTTPVTTVLSNIHV